MQLTSIKNAVEQRRGNCVERASFSLFLAKARAEAKPQRGPKKDRRSLKGLRGCHYRKWRTHRAESRATWRATSPIPGRTAAKLNMQSQIVGLMEHEAPHCTMRPFNALGQSIVEGCSHPTEVPNLRIGMVWRHRPPKAL